MRADACTVELAVWRYLDQRCLKALQKELDALDVVIPLHKVRVDPKVIAGSKPKGSALTQYGQLTRLLLRRTRKRLDNAKQRVSRAPVDERLDG